MEAKDVSGTRSATDGTLGFCEACPASGNGCRRVRHGGAVEAPVLLGKEARRIARRTNQEARRCSRTLGDGVCRQIRSTVGCAFFANGTVRSMKTDRSTAVCSPSTSVKNVTARSSGSPPRGSALPASIAPADLSTPSDSSQRCRGMLVSMRAWIRAEWMPNPWMCEGCSPRSRSPDLPTLQGWCARRSRPDSARDGACASGGRCGSRCWVVGVTAGQPSDSPCTSAVGEASKVVLRSDCFDGPRAVGDVAHSRGCPRSPRPQKPEKPVKPLSDPSPAV